MADWRGAWVEGNHSSEVTTDVDLYTFSIDESLNPIALGGTFFSPFEISSSGKFSRIAGLAGIGTDVAKGTKVGVGAYVAYSQLDLDSLYFSPVLALPVNALDETVKTWSAGFAVLADSRHEVITGVDVFFKGRAAALYANGELNADQMAVANQLAAIDRQETFAGLVDGQVGLEVAFGPNATISIFGGAAWRNDVFEIVNPRAGPGDTFSDTFVAAHLQQTELIEYSVGGKVGLNF